MNPSPLRLRSSFLVTFVCHLALVTRAETLDLAGAWRFERDPTNLGAAGNWPARKLGGHIGLPGSLEGNGIGDPITVDTRWTGSIFSPFYFTSPDYAPYRQRGNIKVPFWLQPETHYSGAAWFQRDVEIPATWTGKRIALTLERPHWKTTVWFDGREVGSNDSLSTAHEYDLGDAAPGKHVLTIRVDNSHTPDIGENSHSVSDHTQGNWNGIVGRIMLLASEPVWIDDLQVAPNATDRSVTAHGRLARREGMPLPASVTLVSGTAKTDVPVADDGTFKGTVVLGPGAALWDEFSPALHELTVTVGEALRPDELKSGSTEPGHRTLPAVSNQESRTVRFGLRHVARDGRQLTINGRPLFLRGTLDCAAFPRTGHPPTDVAEWTRIFSVIRAHGLNHVRFHSWCPPEAAFTAADELGLYLQVEVASWPNWSTTLGDGKPVDAWTDMETARILRAYGNHPSFIILCAGNEPGGDHHAAWLSGWTARQKERDPRRLYTAGAGWPEVPENDLHVRSEPRIQQWGDGLKSRINARPPETRTDYRDFINARSVPVVSHEIGQWCVYPNYAEMPKYTGYLKPRNFEIFQASLAARGQLAQAHDFLIASGKLQALCYKEDIESALRTPGMGGFQLLGLYDFPGQGTALVGVLDAFWEEKGYITPAEFKRFSGSTVPLARLERRIFTTADTLAADLEVAHFGADPLTAATHWQLVGDNGKTVAHGKFDARPLPVGNGTALGRVELPLKAIPAPARYKMVVTLEGTPFANDWDVWVYPADVKQPAADNVLVVSKFDATAEAKLAAGGTVFLTIPPANVAPDPQRGPIALGFSSIFWNTAWTSGQAPHTLGILCDPKHPALTSFPTDPWSNWQWWYPIKHAAPLLLDALPKELRPTVQVIDDWFTNRRLALVFEAKVGKGKLLVTSIDFTGDLDLVRRQLRDSLLAYATGSRFSPNIDVTPAQVRTLLQP
jgi:hypothetical protein